MGDRYWLWTGARLLVAVAIVAWAGSYLGTGSGEKDFQKTLDAMKQVHSFRASLSANPGTQRDEALWEVDCSRDLLHHQMHFTDTSINPPAEMSRDETVIAGREYDRKGDGSWSPPQYGYGMSGGSAASFCRKLAQGTDTNLLPEIATMIRRGIIQKGDKKTVNGVRCREYLVTMKGGTSGLEHDTVCIGLEDRLPYELTVDWAHSRFSFSDYNASLQIDVPEGALKPASSISN